MRLKLLSYLFFALFGLTGCSAGFDSEYSCDKVGGVWSLSEKVKSQHDITGFNCAGPREIDQGNTKKPHYGD
ncbi:TPA: hypothetical protein ACGWRI_004598 [Vibrio vulnificus]